MWIQLWGTPSWNRPAEPLWNRLEPRRTRPEPALKLISGVAKAKPTLCAFDLPKCQHLIN